MKKFKRILTKKLSKILIISFFLIVSKSIALENKIILKIDNDIITTLDVFDEKNSLQFFNKNFDQINSEEKYEISLQSIVKTRIKKNEIIKRIGEIKLEDTSYLDIVIKNRYENLGFKDLENFKKELNNKKISYENFEQKLKIDILWNQLIYTLYYNKVSINENELKKQIENQKEFVTSFKLSEIVFQIDEVNNLNNRYNLIKKDINELGFESAALKYSISNTATTGGDIGWVNENKINKEILEVLNKTTEGSITQPIRIPSGFLILKKNELKKEKKKLNIQEELKKLVNYQTEMQLNNYSNIYFNKIKKDLNIDVL
jgi:peptidyl-prolyl cis-trans isomerase SurA